MEPTQSAQRRGEDPVEGLRTFEYEHDGVTLKGELALPAGPGPHPAVLVMHHAIGLGSNEMRRARMLADAGYVALATDMYGIGTREVPQSEYAPLFMALQEDPAKLRARVLAGYEALRARPEVDPGRIGAIGFCFGGQCVLELARSGAEAAAVVSFHGILTARNPARPGTVKARVLAIAGALDPYAPPADVEAFQKEMTAAGVDWHLTVYGQGMHAFTDPSVEDHGVPGVRYDALLDRLSWSQATAFLDAALEPAPVAR
jgi:dienelactone hydrolase